MPGFGWWTTGRDEAAVDLFETVSQAIARDTIPGKISYLFCSRDPGEGQFSDRVMEMAAGSGVSVVSSSAARFAPELRRKDREQWRADYHRRVLELVEGFPVDVVVLAGYMWVVSPEVCRRLSVINLHPAAPNGPAGTWQEVIWQLLEGRAGETGVMMHLVTPELDKGPPVTYCTFAIRGGGWEPLWRDFEQDRQRLGIDLMKASMGESQPLFAAIRRQGARRELPLIVQTLRSLARGDILLRKGRLFESSGSELTAPYDLTEPTEQSLRDETGNG
jgi:phosphoribosylglycinamide formyltransferase-1